MIRHKCKIENGQIIPIKPDRFKNDLTIFEGKFIELQIDKLKKTRTSQQNRALHLWFTQLAVALNNAGWDMRKLIRKEVDIPWSGISVKEYLWRPIQENYLKKKSTIQLKTEEIDQIFDIVNRIVGERTGVYIPFPSIETLFEEYEKELRSR